MAVYVVAKLTTPDSSPLLLPGVTRDATLGDSGRVLFRNSLVLALHAMACVAGFIAGSSLPLSAAQRSGAVPLGPREGGPARDRLRGLRHHLLAVHPGLRARGRRLDRRRRSSASRPALLLLALLPHALPELVALFLPLAAWISPAAAGTGTTCSPPPS